MSASGSGAGAVMLSALLAGFGNVRPGDDRAIRDITLDSREVTDGSCFFALLGSRRNALDYALEAASRGAAAIVAEVADSTLDLGIPIIAVPELRRHLGEVANRFFDLPSASVAVYAVTGTNGKTTVAHLTAQAIGILEGGCGYIGTLGAGLPGALKTGPNTTPDVITINRWLARFRDDGVTASSLEASSHALDQDRLSGVQLRAAAFTNLGHDHLDYHGSLAAYGKSKKRLFERDRIEAAIINIDDPLGREIADSLAPTVELWTCSSGLGAGATSSQARVCAELIESTARGVSFVFHANGRQQRVESALVGRFNVDNLLIIGASMLSAGYEFDAVCACLAQLGQVPGRMELCGTSARGARVFIDYAHSPDSLAAALGALRELGPRHLYLVFGCGGDRDVTKRPLMGATAARLADHVNVTADNPRDEDARAIADDILAGMADDRGARVILDRAEAIRNAVVSAAEGDIVLVAGKGDETTQEQGGVRRPFSDRTVALDILAEAAS